MEQPIRINPRKLHGLFNIMGSSLIIMTVLSVGSELIYPFLIEYFADYLIGYDMITVQTIYEIIVKVIVFTLPFLFAHLFLEISYRDLFRFPRLGVSKNLMLSCQAVAIYLFFSFIVNSIFFKIMPDLVETADLHQAFQGNRPWLAAGYIAYFVFLIPLLEEYVFRGAILRCTSWVGGNFGMVCSSLIYMVYYVGQSSMLVSFMLGLYLCLISMMYQSIWPAYLSHVAINITIVISMFLPSSLGWVFGVLAVVVYGVSVYSLIINRKSKILLKQELSLKRVWRYFFTSWLMLLAIFVLILRAVYIIIR